MNISKDSKYYWENREKVLMKKKLGIDGYMKKVEIEAHKATQEVFFGVDCYYDEGVYL